MWSSVPKTVVYTIVVFLIVCGCEITQQCKEDSGGGKGWMQRMEQLKQCCNVPKVEMASEEIIIKCTALVNQTETKRNKNQVENCVTQCIFNESQYINESSEFNIEKIKENFKQALQDNVEWVEVFTNATDTCLNNKMRKFSKRLKKMGENKKNNNCNPVPNQLVKCTYITVFKNCPEAAKNKTEECTAAQNENNRRKNGKGNGNANRRNQNKVNQQNRNNEMEKQVKAKDSSSSSESESKEVDTATAGLETTTSMPLERTTLTEVEVFD